MCDAWLQPILKVLGSLCIMEQHVFVLQFIMPLKSIYNQNLGFIEQKPREVQTIKNYELT